MGDRQIASLTFVVQRRFIAEGEGLRIMKGFFTWQALGLVAIATACIAAPQQQANPPGPQLFPSYNASANDPRYSGLKFYLSQDFPREPPPRLPPGPFLPWEHFDFRKPIEREAYMYSVLRYCFQGNVVARDDECFRVERKKRPWWFHAPYMHPGTQGRESIHGTTYERKSRPHELWWRQKSSHNTYAISFFDTRAAYTLGKVWRPVLAGQSPAVDGVRFEEGAVCFKLIFTTATPAEVQYLDGAPEWEVYGFRDQLNRRERTRVRLLQVDIAVRDRRAHQPGENGWVYGTFQFEGHESKQTSKWYRLIPVSLMWGLVQHRNPPIDLRTGFPLNAKTWINPSSRFVKYRARVKLPIAISGRANGPVDNKDFSCMDCHIRATVKTANGQRPLDLSLQLSKGLENYLDEHPSSPLRPHGNLPVPPRRIDRDRVQ
jgi:hypothetical protein